MELLVTITTPPDLLSNITPSPTLQIVIKPIPSLSATINTNLHLVNGLSAYEVAVLNGFVGTEEEWLVSLIGQQGIQGVQGIPGQDGEPIELRVANNYIQYKYLNDVDWINLKNLDELKGTDGREIELVLDSDWLKWKYLTDITWTNLVSLSAITGAAGIDGREVLIRNNGTAIQWKYSTEVDWIDIELLSNLKGADGQPGLNGLNGLDGLNGTNGLDGVNGREIELNKSSTHIQWRYVGDVSWLDLIALTELKGADGQQGLNGKEIELNNSGTYIQWRYVGESNWINLVALSTLVGAKGDTGSNIELNKSTTHIQWRVVGSSTWLDLVALSDLKGDKGDTGTVVITDSVLAIDYLMNGFTLLSETTISFNPATFVFTIAPTGTTWNYYRSGVKHTITGSKTLTLSGNPPATNKYFIYLDSIDGTLSDSTISWTLGETETKVPVATITFNNSLTPKYLLGDERHPLIPRNEHRHEHSAGGTKLITRTAITTLNVDQDNNVNKRPTLSAGEISDEHLFIQQASLTPAGSPYTSTDYAIVYRTASSTWAWMKSAMPFKYNGATGTIQYDNNGTMTDGVGGTGGNRRWFNYYLIQTDILNDGFQFVWMPGRGSFTTLALAQAEDVSSFTLTNFPITEFVIVYRVTFAIDAVYSSAGKCVVKASQQVNVGSISGVIGTSNSAINTGVPINVGTLTTVGGYISEIVFKYIPPKDFIWNNTQYNTSSGVWIDAISYNENISSAVALVSPPLLSSVTWDIVGSDGGVGFSYCPNLTTINLSSLVHVNGVFNLINLPSLQTLNLSNLKYVNGAFNLQYNTGATITLGTIEYISGSPAITLQNGNVNNITFLNTLKYTFGFISFSGGNTAFDLDLSNLIVCSAITDNALFKSITLTKLKVWYSNFSLSTTNTNITSLSLPALEFVGGYFTVTGKANLTSLSLASIQGIYGAITINSGTASLTTMTLGANLKFVNGNVVISSCALNQASVDNILVSLAALNGTNGTITYSSKTVTITGTSATPSATGLAAKATLIARGCTVTTN